MGSLAGKRALVTGASRGIGAAIAIALAREGSSVAITYERSADKAAGVVDRILGFGVNGVSIQADSADAVAVPASVRSAVAALGGLDILVNNAGISRRGPLTSLELVDIDVILSVNVRASVLAIQAAIPHLGAGSRIIGIGSSLAERVPQPGLALYAMSKSALVGLTRGLARDLGPAGITVNIVHPGPTDTDMNPASGLRADAQRGQVALGRYSTPEDVAAMVVFLAGPAGLGISGASFAIDGGLNA